ncbi:hypothetical protein Micbo1qcDRAFT_200303 [Microdochium bolleyi]|uniref:ARB-07466-like C-terminal domain-containing protein n=1 Tax=Microdochium bolleyi TaxID=196109 RepID=A0A136JKH6_9PEZI|nr:hypothetical protein Micbo1qcDRAFT_200303 [Microdochium bolleyi]
MIPSRTSVCVDSAACTTAGGTSISGACPSDPSNVKCCTKPSCSNGSAGNCRWTSDCAGTSVSGQCPGPSAMQCCSSAATGFGGYAKPTLGKSGCLDVSIKGSDTVLAKFPGRIKNVYCIRENCSCQTSDHCCGGAIDFMCSDSGGAATLSGIEIAEWIMNNANAQNVKYIIFGQRIWQSTETVTGWSKWRGMDDRGDMTANHW